MDLTFSGAGFMGCYYFGVVDCWRKYIPQERVNRVAGASAGALIAAYYLMDLPLSTCLKEITDMTEDIRKRPLGVFDRSNQIVDILPRVLDKLFPDDAHKRVSDKLYVCMTRLKDMKKIIINEFESKKDLIDALNCSCFIPLWSGNHVSTFRGVKHIDGGFSDNLPVFDEHTIRICCFSGATDISPYDRAKLDLLSANILNMPVHLNFANCRRMRKALFPPKATSIMELLERGFHDTKDFILTNDLIQCDSCYAKTNLCDQPIYSKISPTITPCVSPSMSRAASFANFDDVYSLDPSKGAPRNGDDTSSCNKFLHPAATKRVSSFSSLLRDKLRSCSPDSDVSAGSSDMSGSNPKASTSSSCQQDANNNNNNNSDSTSKLVPVIVVESEVEKTADSGAEVDDDDDGDSSKNTTSPSSDDANHETGSADKKSRANEAPAVNMFRTNRRNTIQQEKDLIVIKDKFAFAPNPLPSCPPSPNLNRHCTECIRMRQEARIDLVADEIRAAAERYRDSEQCQKESTFKSKLSSPFRWIRQWGIKSSYKFQDQIPTLAL